tara:strand:+ start:4173 stop:4574 length:402 start_codon:yes stop_codon:yes gene_type:complete
MSRRDLDEIITVHVYNTNSEKENLVGAIKRINDNPLLVVEKFKGLTGGYTISQNIEDAQRSMVRVIKNQVWAQELHSDLVEQRLRLHGVSYSMGVVKGKVRRFEAKDAEPLHPYAKEIKVSYNQRCGFLDLEQ